MRTLGVAMSDPPAKASFQLSSGLEGMEVGASVPQGAPEAFDKDVVHPPAPAIHADPDLASRSTLAKAREANWLP